MRQSCADNRRWMNASRLSDRSVGRPLFHPPE
jgi:hypothetical protein